MTDYKIFKDKIQTDLPSHTLYDDILRSLPKTEQSKNIEGNIVDLRFLRAMGYISYTPLNDNFYDVTLTDAGMIFITEDGFRGFNDRKLKELEVVKDQWISQRVTTWTSIITTLLAIITLLSQKDNALGECFRSVFSCN